MLTSAAWPALMLTVFFAVPLGIMLTVSFFHRVEGGFFEPGFEFANYARFLEPFFLRVLTFTLGVSALASVLCLAVAVPFTWQLTRMSRRPQLLWPVLLLAILSLSEVIVGFAWSLLLSRSVGVGNLLVMLGFTARAPKLAPGFGAVLIGLCYLGFPYAVLVLFPALSRLDPRLPEAARMLGASPTRAFISVVVPALRGPLAAALVIVFVFTLGAYLIPQLLGRPQHWTLPVLIADQALFQSNLPFAAAMSIFLLAVSLSLVAAVNLAAGPGAPPCTPPAVAP
jgi:putative spermidine/putrescine transport system permease protein